MKIAVTVLVFLGLFLSSCTKDPIIEPVAIQKEVEYQLYVARDYNGLWFANTEVTLRLYVGKISLSDQAFTTLFDSTFNNFTLGQFSS